MKAQSVNIYIDLLYGYIVITVYNPALKTCCSYKWNM